MFDKDFLKDTLAQIVAGVVLFALTTGWIFWDYVKDFGTIISTPITIPAFVAPLSFLFGLLVFYSGIKFWDWYSMTQKDYRKDEFYGVYWTWEYEDGQVNTKSIKPICPKCNSRMKMYEHSDVPLPEQTFLDVETEIKCVSSECENSFQVGEELSFFGEKDHLLKTLEDKIDKKLRDKGLIL